MTTPRLELANVGRRFGGLQAVADVSFSVARGEIFGIIGPNGAGKTTLFNLIAGIYRPTSGRVVYEGREITGMNSDAVARQGIARTFQTVHAFKEASVLENLRRAAVLARSCDPLRYAKSAWQRHRGVGADACEKMARFIGLSDFLHTAAGSLSYGSKKILGIGMALMEAPKVLLMDEPAAGLNPTEKLRVGEIVRRIRDEQGIDVLLVEHDMRLIMGICDRILVLNQGRMVTVGTPDAVRSDQEVIDAYLGVEYEFA